MDHSSAFVTPVVTDDDDDDDDDNDDDDDDDDDDDENSGHYCCFCFLVPGSQNLSSEIEKISTTLSKACWNFKN